LLLVNLFMYVFMYTVQSLDARALVHSGFHCFRGTFTALGGVAHWRPTFSVSRGRLLLTPLELDEPFTEAVEPATALSEAVQPDTPPADLLKPDAPLGAVPAFSAAEPRLDLVLATVLGRELARELSPLVDELALEDELEDELLPDVDKPDAELAGRRAGMAGFFCDASRAASALCRMMPSVAPAPEPRAGLGRDGWDRKRGCEAACSSEKDAKAASASPPLQ
jgi:hypothetical protein